MADVIVPISIEIYSFSIEENSEYSYRRISIIKFTMEEIAKKETSFALMGWSWVVVVMVMAKKKEVEDEEGRKLTRGLNNENLLKTFTIYLYIRWITVKLKFLIKMTRTWRGKRKSLTTPLLLCIAFLVQFEFHHTKKRRKLPAT